MADDDCRFDVVDAIGIYLNAVIRFYLDIDKKSRRFASKRIKLNAGESNGKDNHDSD